MKKDQLAKTREKNLKELEVEIVKLKKELAEKNLAKSGGKLKNVKLVARLRRDLGQLQTIVAIKKFQEEQNA